MDKRLAAASGAFGALRKCVFGNKDISYRVQGKVYQALILSVLLYGSECWTLTSEDRARIIRFHRRCVRTMCRVNLRMTMQGRIKTTTLLKRCGCQSMDYYINVRCLRWAGHLVRMPRYRLPRQLFFSKVPHARRSGGQYLSYGWRVQREVDKAMKRADVAVVRKMTGRRGIGWMAYAGSGEMSRTEKEACRGRWREFICSGRIDPPRRPTAKNVTRRGSPQRPTTTNVTRRGSRRRRAGGIYAGGQPPIPPAPDGVPAFESSQFTYWLACQPRHICRGLCEGAHLYELFIKDWVTRMETEAEATIAAAAAEAAARG